MTAIYLLCLYYKDSWEVGSRKRLIKAAHHQGRLPQTLPGIASLGKTDHLGCSASLCLIKCFIHPYKQGRLTSGIRGKHFLVWWHLEQS